MSAIESEVSTALWSSTLDHFVLQSADPARLIAFYEQALQLEPSDLGDGTTLMSAPGRRFVIAPGESERVPGFALDAGNSNRLGVLRHALESNGVALEPADSPLLEPTAFSVLDPDGVRVTFGTPERSRRQRPFPGDKLPGRLQHIVYASTDPVAVMGFYREKLGFVLSDTVLDDDEALTAMFIRSDPEHHSFASFRAPEARFDHVALETTGWMDIRDWADHVAALEIPIWWGPGRHGPGNNLFFMIRDPDGNRIEISAECEHMPRAMAPRVWPHNERTLNLWGASWMRS